MILTVHVKPNAQETKIVAWQDAATVTIAVHALPKEGEANRELINFLAKRLKVAKSLVEIKRGQGSRVKHVSIPDKIQLSALKN